MATSEGNFIAEVDRDDEADRPVVRAGVLAWRAEGVGEMALAFGVSACRFPALGRQRPKTRAVSRPKPLFRDDRRAAGGINPAPPRGDVTVDPNRPKEPSHALIRTALPWRMTVHFCA